MQYQANIKEKDVFFCKNSQGKPCERHSAQVTSRLLLSLYHGNG